MACIASVHYFKKKISFNFAFFIIHQHSYENKIIVTLQMHINLHRQKEQYLLKNFQI